MLLNNISTHHMITATILLNAHMTLGTLVTNTSNGQKYICLFVIYNLWNNKVDKTSTIFNEANETFTHDINIFIQKEWNNNRIESGQDLYSS